MDLSHLFPRRSALIRPQSNHVGSPTESKHPNSKHLSNLRFWTAGLTVSTTALTLGLSTLLGVATPLLSVQPAQAQLANVLRRGQESSAVKALQERLIGLGYLSNNLATGFYGEQTEAAVLQFQRDEQLFQDGIVGAKTLEALDLLGQGGRSAAVLDLNRRQIGVLQTRLIALGYDAGVVDGVAGAQTASALANFQRNNELRVNPEATTLALEQVTRIYERQLPSVRSSDRGVVSSTLNTTLPAPSAGMRDPEISIPRPQSPSQVGFGTFQTGRQTDIWDSDRSEFNRNSRPFSSNLSSNASVNNSVSGRPYVLAVPGQSGQLLREVQIHSPGAFRAESKRGNYIHAGAFSNRAAAEDEEQYLRRQGLDARVIFLP